MGSETLLLSNWVKYKQILCEVPTLTVKMHENGILIEIPADSL